MPRQRQSGYARLAQAEEEDREQGHYDDSDSDDVFSSHAPLSNPTRYAAIQPTSRDRMRAPSHDAPNGQTKRPLARKRMRSNSSGVDIKAINARLEKWAEEIASKFKLTSVKGKSPEEERLEIHHSVFQAPDGIRPLTAEALALEMPTGNGDRMSKVQFDDVVESVRIAIEIGVHPKMISQGSSGSYFARNSEGKVVGVFKPKDEEPYASRNPKWTKWIHRNLFPCCFGRACLIPNLSYVSEAAAYVLDAQLRTNLVPYTDIVHLSSKSFFYDFWDRRSTWGSRKSLPAKVGSFQVFLKGYKDAHIFLREHPWPDQANGGFNAEDVPPKKKRHAWSDCRPSGAPSDDEEDPHRPLSSPVPEEPSERAFHWSSTLKQAFREELEKLVVLDYIMRNTDRGLDNWMVKIDWHTEEVSIVSEPPRLNGAVDEPSPPARPLSINAERPISTDLNPYRRHEAMSVESRSATPSNHQDGATPLVSIGAIDNSLSWPWKHPDAWRSFPFGWLFLPVSLIGQPFSTKTRDHFLPLLTSTAWWGETQLALRRVFAQDADFKESMFARQIAVMKGQAWNVVETLKQHDHGPLELTRRTRVCVWDDLVDIPVAIPLTRPSAELRRRRNVTLPEQEEMDIGASRGSDSVSEPVKDLLGSPTGELPNPNRFELTRDEDAADLSRSGEEPTGSAPVGVAEFAESEARQAKQNLSSSFQLPPRPSAKSKTRFSFDFSQPSPTRRTRHSKSFSTRRTSNPRMYGGDDLEGDLGYAAAGNMEGSQRKVIVERWEAVKSKNPVFTWC